MGMPAIITREELILRTLAHLVPGSRIEAEPIAIAVLDAYWSKYAEFYLGDAETLAEIVKRRMKVAKLKVQNLD